MQQIVLLIVYTVSILFLYELIRKFSKREKKIKAEKSISVKTQELQENNNENPFVSWWIVKILLITGTTYVLKNMGIDTVVKNQVLKKMNYNLPSEGIVNDKTIVYNKLVEVLTDFSIGIHTTHNVPKIIEDVSKFIDMVEDRLHKNGYPEDLFTYKRALEILYDYDSTIKIGDLMKILRDTGIIDESNHKLQTSELGKQELHKIMVQYMKLSYHKDYKYEVMELIATLEKLEVPLLDTLEEIQRDFKNINDRYKEKYEDSVRYTYALKEFVSDNRD